MNATNPAADLKDQTRQVLDKAGDQISEHASNLRDLATDVRFHGEDFIQTYPWLAVGVAAGAGLLVGLLIARR